MWNSYFRQIQNKYAMRVSLKNPLVIKLDGKGITKNPKINLLDTGRNSFLDCLEKTARNITQKYHCYAIFGTDEISFIFIEPILLLEELHEGQLVRTNDIIALFSQYFFDMFNNLYNRDVKIFFHGKCFSISKDKFKSYIKFRSGVIKNVTTTYFLKKMNVKDSGTIKLDEKIEMCKKYKNYIQVKKIENGLLYFDGEKIDIEEFLKGNIKKVEYEEKNEVIDYFDITMWNEEFEE